MKFSELSKYILRLEETPSRNEMMGILAELIKKAELDETEEMIYLLLGVLAPSYKGIVFNLAERMMIEVVAEAYGKEKSEVVRIYKEKGDLGNVAMELSQVSTVKELSVREVHERLRKIAEDEGEGSQERKISKMAVLLSSLDPLSARYVARIPVGRLRLGFSDKTVLDALSFMERGDKSAKKKLEQVYNVLPDVGRLARMIKERGVDEASKNVVPTTGVPVISMLAQRLKSPDEMIKKMGRVSVEPKLDGLRIAIHYKGGKEGFIMAFTRNLNETSWMFPELKDMKNQVRAKELILDSEAVGVDKKLEAMVNFQTTMTRRRKHEIAEISKKVQIQFHVFDVLHIDGKSMINEPYTKRREVLERVVCEGKLFKIVEHEITSDPERIRFLNNKDRSEGLEGIIVKKADSKYVSGRTGWRWVKMKEAEEDKAKLADTVDCLVMGYTLGKGKRAQFGVGQFLVGAVDGEKVKTVSKIGTGLTDEQFRELKKRLSELEVKDKPKTYVVDKNLAPDYWVKPGLIVEVAADEITISPRHSGGLALRFPRLVRFRDDKSIEQATTLKEIRDLYKQQ